jgi:phage terminase large subunit-like protein
VGGGQCAGRTKGNAILVIKQASGSAKIDPLMAAFNAIGARGDRITAARLCDGLLRFPTSAKVGFGVKTGNLR